MSTDSENGIIVSQTLLDDVQPDSTQDSNSDLVVKALKCGYINSAGETVGETNMSKSIDSNHVQCNILACEVCDPPSDTSLPANNTKRDKTTDKNEEEIQNDSNLPGNKITSGKTTEKTEEEIKNEEEIKVKVTSKLAQVSKMLLELAELQDQLPDSDEKFTKPVIPFPNHSQLLTEIVTISSDEESYPSIATPIQMITVSDEIDLPVMNVQKTFSCSSKQETPKLTTTTLSLQSGKCSKNLSDLFNSQDTGFGSSQSSTSSQRLTLETIKDKINGDHLAAHIKVAKHQMSSSDESDVEATTKNKAKTFKVNSTKPVNTMMELNHLGVQNYLSGFLSQGATPHLTINILNHHNVPNQTLNQPNLFNHSLPSIAPNLVNQTQSQPNLFHHHVSSNQATSLGTVPSNTSKHANLNSNNVPQPVQQPNLNLHHVPQPIPNQVNSYNDYQTNSKSVTYSELKVQLLDPSFIRTSLKSFGFAPISFFKPEDSSGLDTWMVPGLLCDMGLNIPLSEAKNLFASDISENPLGVPVGDLSVLVVNNYLKRKYSPALHSHSPAFMGNKMNQALGPIFYTMYSWVDPSAAILTELEILQLLTDQDALFMYPNLAPWPVTIFPRDIHDAKYFSVFRNGEEYVCRTKADRQKGVDYFSEHSEIFNCVICKDIISTSFHTFVFCFTFEEGSDFKKILLHRKSFLRACYLHFKLEGVKLPGRNPYKFSQVESSSAPPRGGSGFRGRGSRGRAHTRRGIPTSKLFN